MAVVNFSGNSCNCVYPEYMGKVNIKKSIKKAVNKIKTASPAKKVLAAALLGPLAPALTSKVIAAGVTKKGVEALAKKSPKLKATIEKVKKLPLKKKLLLVGTGGLLAPLAPVVIASAIPTATAVGGIVATKKIAQKISSGIKARNAAEQAAMVNNASPVQMQETVNVPVSARTDSGNIDAVNEAANVPVESETTEKPKSSLGTALKFIAPLAIMPFLFGEV